MKCIDLKTKLKAINLLSSWRDRIDREKLSKHQVLKELQDAMKVEITIHNLDGLIQVLEPPIKFSSAGKVGGIMQMQSLRNRINLLEERLSKLEGQLVVAS